VSDDKGPAWTSVQGSWGIDRGAVLRTPKNAQNDWDKPPKMFQTYTHPEGGTLTITVEVSGTGMWHIAGLDALGVYPIESDGKNAGWINE
jgi:hypothetical protein